MAIGLFLWDEDTPSLAGRDLHKCKVYDFSPHNHHNTQDFDKIFFDSLELGRSYNRNV